ncbi:alpha/beta hydrolase [uncultured Anaerococcus sp.]|uniref:alpha/beta fold hydrolase n=1 Tax=uncultured Anaerococcus sp. TaxID=293428 RepID=UPI00288C5830|nr:alpha/beta hydrolase [uncultured Anaerococcus sp.]
MKFITYGNKDNKSLLFIHGLASSANLCFGGLLPYLKDYYVILVELDGHCPSDENDLNSMGEEISKIENYILKNLKGNLYGLCGFSMGGTLAVDLISRGNICVEKVLLDAPITAELGWKAYPYTQAFIIGTTMIKKSISIPKFMIDWLMGKDNDSVIEMTYKKISKKSIKNVCKYIFHYQINENLRNFHKPVLFWRGRQEQVPEISQDNLMKYLPQMKVEIFEGMGHGQYLHEHPAAYAEKLKVFFND